MSQLFPGCFVGSSCFLSDSDWLRDNNVRYVLKFSDHESGSGSRSKTAIAPDFKPDIMLEFDSLANSKQATLLPLIPELMAFLLIVIAMTVEGGTSSLLICSPDGKSRAPIVAATMFVVSQKVSTEQALGAVKENHPDTDVHHALIQQLKAFEAIIRDPEQQKAFYMRMKIHSDNFNKKLQSSNVAA